LIQEFLRSIPLFSELDDDELTHVLIAGIVRRYPEGTLILRDGAEGGQLHVIHQGRVRIGKMVPGFGEEALVILDPGAIFGEVEFLDGGTACAQAVAHTDCEVLTIPHGEVSDLMNRRPELAARFLGYFARTLAARLRESNQRVVSLFALSRSH
jgi:CRP/FNR family transcriptional regulator, cyclic AMP receptor protein